MRAVVLTYRPEAGAWATVARNLAVGLSAQGIEVDVLYLAGPEPQAVPGYPMSVRLTRLGGRSRTCWLKVSRHLRARRPDVMVSLGWILNPAAVVAVAFARTRTPLILNEGSSLSYKSRVEHRAEPALRLLAWTARHLYPRAAAVTGTSSAVVNDLQEEIGLSPRRVLLEVVPNAVDGREVRRRSAEPAAVITGPGPVFVNVARHVRQKNLHLLIRAFHSYVSDGHPGVLVLCGDGPVSPSLQRMAQEMGLAQRVHFRGHQDNPFPQVAAATAFVLSSEEEGFGLALVEAMSLGVPVIASDCPGGPREILQHGRCGLIVPPGDHAALARAMAVVVTDATLGQRLAAQGIARAADYEPEVVAERWIDVMQAAGVPIDVRRLDRRRQRPQPAPRTPAAHAHEALPATDI